MVAFHALVRVHIHASIVNSWPVRSSGHQTAMPSAAVLGHPIPGVVGCVGDADAAPETDRRLHHRCCGLGIGAGRVVGVVPAEQREVGAQRPDAVGLQHGCDPVLARLADDDPPIGDIGTSGELALELEVDACGALANHGAATCDDASDGREAGVALEPARQGGEPGPPIRIPRCECHRARPPVPARIAVGAHLCEVRTDLGCVEATACCRPSEPVARVRLR